jgi:hypothetical protein
MTNARRGALSGLLAILFAGTPLFAQESSTVDVGMSVVHFPDDSATIGGPWARWLLSRETSRAKVTGSLTGVSSFGAFSASADVDGAARRALGTHWIGEADGSLSSWFNTMRTNVSSATAGGRLARPMDGGGVWLRADGTLSHRESGGLWGQQVETGTWRQLGDVAMTMSLSRTWAKAQYFDGTVRDRVVSVAPAAYTEGAIGVTAQSEAVTVGLSAGVRADPDAQRRVEPVLLANALFWVSPTSAIVFNVGFQPPDFLRGADATQSLSIGMRFSEPSRTELRALASRPIVQLSEAGGVSMLRVRAIGARRVELMADFTEWEAVELHHDGELFTMPITVRAGTHRIALRIDGGPWTTAANTPAVDDDLGGRVGLFVVP